MRRPRAAALFGCTSLVFCTSLVLMLTANASDLPDRSRAYGETSSQLSRSQISGTPRASPGTSKSSSLATNQVGILFLRGDGGDPKELQVENDTLVYIAVRDGSGSVYQNGYAVGLDPAIQASAGQIVRRKSPRACATGARSPGDLLGAHLRRALREPCNREALCDLASDSCWR